MVLVDTSVWVEHLRRGSASLARLLEAGRVACHPFVVGELACGGIRNRREFLALLSSPPTVPRAADEEVLRFIDHHALAGRGLGLIDVHLLASCLLGGAALWTGDARLAAAARDLQVAADVPALLRGLDG